MEVKLISFLATIATDNDALTSYLRNPGVAMAEAGLPDGARQFEDKVKGTMRWPDEPDEDEWPVTYATPI